MKKNQIHTYVRVGEKTIEGIITEIGPNSCVFKSEDQLGKYGMIEENFQVRFQVKIKGVIFNIKSVIRDIDESHLFLKFTNLSSKEERLIEQYADTKSIGGLNFLDNLTLNVYAFYKSLSRNIVLKIFFGVLLLLSGLIVLCLRANDLMFSNYIVLSLLFIGSGKALGLFKGLVYYYVPNIKSSFISHEADILRAAQKEIKVVSGWISHLCYDHPIFKRNLWEAMKEKNVELKIIFYKEYGIDPKSKTFIKWFLNNKKGDINISLYSCDLKADNHFIVVDDAHLLIESPHAFGKPPKNKLMFFYSPLVTESNEEFRGLMMHSKRVTDLRIVFKDSIIGLIKNLEIENDKKMVSVYMNYIPGQIALWKCLSEKYYDKEDGESLDQYIKVNFIPELETAVKNNDLVCLDSEFCTDHSLDEKRFCDYYKKIYSLIINEY